MTCLFLLATHFGPSPGGVEKPHQPQLCLPPLPLSPSLLFLAAFSVPPTELLGRVPEAWGPWCSLAWYVLCRLRVQVALQSPTKTCLLLPRCGRNSRLW